MLQIAKRFWGPETAATRPVPAQSPTRQAEARLVETLDDAERLWRDMAADADSTVFQTWEVFQAWARTIAAGAQCRWFVSALLDARTRKPLLLLPLVLRTEDGLDVIESADLGVADFYAPVIARGFVPTAAEMECYWSLMKHTFPTADLLRLSKMPQRIGRSRNPLLLLPNVNTIKLTNLKTALEPDWQAWLIANVPEKIRHDIAVRRRKLGKRGNLRLVTAETGAEADRFFAAMLAQRQERYKALGRRDILDDPNCRHFYRSLIRPGERNSVGTMQALLVDNEIVATGLGLVYNDAFHMIFPAFAGNGWRNYSPGLQLFFFSLEWAAARGFSHYDFTIGDESFKRNLGAEEFPLYEKLVAISAHGRQVVYMDRFRRFIRRNPQLSRLAESLRGRIGREDQA